MSLYLDLTRILAAVFVFFDHCPGFMGEFLWQLSGFGHYAVVYFFVLSGFLIRYVTEAKETRALDYAASRVARIYSVALPALAITLALYYLGKWMVPGAYPQLDGKMLPPGPTIILALSFLNQSWASTTVFANIPYWSLGYEVPYYALFGIWMFTSGKKRAFLIPLAMLAMGPSVAMDLPLWLLGVACRKAQTRWRPGPAAGAALFALSLSLCAVYAMPPVRAHLESASHALLGPWWTGHLHPPAGRFASDYALGCAIALNIFAFSAFCERIPVPALPARCIQYAATCTFSVYLLHMPLIAFVATLWPADRSPRANLFGCLIATPAAILLFSAYAEKSKYLYKRAFRKVFAPA